MISWRRQSFTVVASSTSLTCLIIFNTFKISLLEILNPGYLHKITWTLGLLCFLMNVEDLQTEKTLASALKASVEIVFCGIEDVCFTFLQIVFCCIALKWRSCSWDRKMWYCNSQGFELFVLFCFVSCCCIVLKSSWDRKMWYYNSQGFVLPQHDAVCWSDCLYQSIILVLICFLFKLQYVFYSNCKIYLSKLLNLFVSNNTPGFVLQHDPVNYSLGCNWPKHWISEFKSWTFSDYRYNSNISCAAFFIRLDLFNSGDSNSSFRPICQLFTFWMSNLLLQIEIQILWDLPSSSLAASTLWLYFGQFGKYLLFAPSPALPFLHLSDSTEKPSKLWKKKDNKEQWAHCLSS